MKTVVVGAFGQQHILGAVGEPAPEGNVAGAAAHDLYHAAPVVGLGGVTDAVDPLA